MGEEGVKVSRRLALLSQLGVRTPEHGPLPEAAAPATVPVQQNIYR